MFRRYLSALIVFGTIAHTGLTSGQEATLNSAVTRSSITKVKIDTFAFDRGVGIVRIGLVYQDASNVDVPAVALATNFTVPSSAGAPCSSATTLNGLTGAMNTARATETGSNSRIQQFRILGYLADQGCLTGVTLVP